MVSGKKSERKEKSAVAEDVEGLDDGLAVDYNLSENEEGFEIDSEKEQDKEDGGDAEDEDDREETEETETSSKKRKISETQKSKKKQKMEYERDSKKTLSSEQGDIIVEKLSSKIREIFPKLSALELADYYLNKNIVVDTSDFTKERDLNNLHDFIEMYLQEFIPNIAEFKKWRNKIKKFENKKKFIKKFNKKLDIPKRRFILVLSQSAIRACDVHRATRDFEGNSLKIIYKNPIGQDLKMLRTTWSRILAATPDRMEKVLKASADDRERRPELPISIKEDEIDAVIIDNQVDQKLRTVLDQRETFNLLKRLKDANPALKVYLY